MAARDPAVAIEANRNQNVAAEAFGEAKTFACAGGRSLGTNPQRTFRPFGQKLFDQRGALLDLADPDPNARIDVAAVEHRHPEPEIVGRPISHRPAPTEGPAPSA